MKPIGQVFRLKIRPEEIRQELTPSFGMVIRNYLGQSVATRFKDPSYVFNITFMTPSLKRFLEKVIEGLKMPTVQGMFLVRGFGFGKTHAIILLWHLLNSREGMRSDLAKSLRSAELASETLVIGVDFSKEEEPFVKEGPFTQILMQLKALADGRSSEVKDPRLTRAAVEAIRKTNILDLKSISSKNLAHAIIEVLENYSRLGGRPSFLLLIDELGVGIVRRLRRYIEENNEEEYSEIDKMLNFIDEIRHGLDGRGIPALIIIALAEQDERELDSISLEYTDKPVVRDKVDGLKKRLSIMKERLSRATGGLLEESVLTYDPEHAINIAKHRVLERQTAEKLEEEFISYLALQARHYNLQKVLDDYKEQIRAYYPLSPSMVWLLRKILNPTDAPKTEYVRAVIYILAEAAENALTYEPEKALAIGAKHTSLARVAAVDLMAELETDWANVLSDIEHSLKTINPELRETAEIIAKQILAKGATADVRALVEVEDPKNLRRYGVTPEEIQLDVITVSPPEDAMKSIERFRGAIEALKWHSARIEEREYNEQKYYVPSLTKTVYDKLVTFVQEEKRNAEKTYKPLYLQQAGVSGLFHNLKANVRSTKEAPKESDVMVLLKDYNTVGNIDALINDAEIRDCQNKGFLSIIVVPPWDNFLFDELYLRNTNYEALLSNIAQKLQSSVITGKILHPLHLIILLPNINQEKISKLIDDLLVPYAAIKKFLKYLEDKKGIISEYVSRYREMIRKRLPRRLAEFIDEKQIEIELVRKLEPQIEKAKNSAHTRLIKLCRELSVATVGLYEKVVYYNIQDQKFDSSRSLTELFIKADKEAEKREKDKKDDISNYSSIMNTFFREVISLTGFNWDTKALGEALYKYYRTEIETGEPRKSDRINEIVENMLLGTYGLKPLSSKVARDAIKELHERVIETRGKRVKLLVDEKQGLIKFEVEEIKPPEELRELAEMPAPPTKELVEPTPLTPTPSTDTINEVLIEMGEGFSLTDFQSRLETLYKTYGTLISSIKLSASGQSLRASFDFLGSDHQPNRIASSANYLRQLASSYGLIPSIEIRFTNPLPRERVKEILGPFFTTKIKRSWDKILTG